jgi:hypothetical protein
MRAASSDARPPRRPGDALAVTHKLSASADRPGRRGGAQLGPGGGARGRSQPAAALSLKGAHSRPAVGRSGRWSGGPAPARPGWIRASTRVTLPPSPASPPPQSATSASRQLIVFGSFLSAHFFRLILFAFTTHPLGHRMGGTKRPTQSIA